MTADLPDYVLDPSPLAMFTRLQRVGLHLERLQAEAMAAVDMSFADYTLLATLHREPAPHALPVSRLAELVIRPMGSITQVVDRLERSGLVCRQLDPGDRRRVLIELTAEGIDLAARGDDAYRVSRERVLAELPEADLVRVDGAITRLLAVLESDQDLPQSA
ncbi:MAG: MarR family transcriptional regulator [Acidimicrobiales bacterium]|nr:MarR family transcriptional regulator [Acidimicrobiales bacterium]